MGEEDGTTIRHAEGDPPIKRSLTDVLVGVAAVANTVSIVGPPVAGKVKEIFQPEPKAESQIIGVPPSYSEKTPDE